MIKFFLILGISYSLASFFSFKSSTKKVLSVKLFFDFMAIMVLGSIDKIDSGELQMLSFLLVLLGVFVTSMMLFLEKKIERV